MLKQATIQDVKAISEQLNFRCTDEELKVFQEALNMTVPLFNDRSECADLSDMVHTGRSLGYRPLSSQNPFNAWYWICNLKDPKAHDNGLLSGKRIGIKDTIAVAGVPMMVGAKMLEGYVPQYDATVITRILNEGGEVYGKTTCEELCMSSSSYCTTYGPVRNPFNIEYSAGGSSSGSAAAIACGDVDMALGCDQGGSIRMPASCCGIVGLKPTFGLVPYTGIVPMLSCVDHVGPMARNVMDCARLLQVIAGFDDHKDCRQSELPFVVPDYLKEISKPVTNIRVGILREAFDKCDEDVVQCVRNALKLIKDSNQFAEMTEVSIPMQADVDKIYDMFVSPGIHKQLVEGDGFGCNMAGHLDEELAERIHQAFKTRSHTLTPCVKSYLLSAAVTADQDMTSYLYARGSNLAYALRKEYDNVLKQVDVFLLPTLPKRVSKLQTVDHLEDNMNETVFFQDNARSFNLTHHPALTLNAGYSEINGMPIGLQIVGRRWEDACVLRVAFSVEKILKHVLKETAH